MSCYFALTLRRMARHIRVARASAQPVPALPEYPPVHFLFRPSISCSFLHLSSHTFSIYFPNYYSPLLISLSHPIKLLPHRLAALRAYPLSPAPFFYAIIEVALAPNQPSAPAPKVYAKQRVNRRRHRPPPVPAQAVISFRLSIMAVRNHQQHIIVHHSILTAPNQEPMQQRILITL